MIIFKNLFLFYSRIAYQLQEKHSREILLVMNCELVVNSLNSYLPSREEESLYYSECKNL
jgi:hypothetical protein